MTETKVVLGNRYVDRVTGFVGVATGRAEYLADTPSVRLTAQTGQDDLKERWVTEGRVDEHAGDPPAGYGAP